MRLRHLKIKLKSLAAEQVIIRHEERKLNRSKIRCPEQYKDDLINEIEELKIHRVGGCGGGGIRMAIRINGLAYAYLRGKKYIQTEQTTHTPKWVLMIHMAALIVKVVEKFGDPNEPDQEVKISNWLTLHEKIEPAVITKMLDEAAA